MTGVMLPAGALLAGPLAGIVGLTATMWIGATGGILAFNAMIGMPNGAMRGGIAA